MVRSQVITQADDWHIHLRDGAALEHTVPATASQFARALAMPNLMPPLTTIDAIEAYQQRIEAALKSKYSFTPYFSLYLNETLTAETLYQAGSHDYVLGAKLYPAGATTNSQSGARSIKALYPLFEVMQQQGLVLQIHGEQAQGDIFERESAFIKQHLVPLVANFPKLRIVLEHVSTQAAVEFVSQAPATVAATITVHHLLYNRNDLLAGGIKPHYYCLPILKKESDRKSLCQAATSANPKFFLGTDSAPHTQASKESACGCAGIFSAPYAMNLYAQVFDNLQALDKLEGFASHYGADFYRLARNKTRCELIKQSFNTPRDLSFGKDRVIPIAANETLEWTVHVE